MTTATTNLADAIGGAIATDTLDTLRAEFQANPRWRLAQNAVTLTTLDDVALDRSVVNTTDHSFSIKLDDWKVTNQKKSGRCWLFAALNLLRSRLLKDMQVDDFEFSQNHAFFWDKFERANYFLEAIIETSDREVDDRTVAFLLERPLDDGGQWNMFVNIVRKHGLVPQAAMPETESSSNSRRMNTMVIAKLRETAARLRALAESGADVTALRSAKDAALAVIWRMLCVHLGTPPDRFDWQWNDKEGELHRDGELTPQEFAARYVKFPLDDMICLVHDPRPSSPFNRTYTVDYLGNVVGGGRVLYLNVEIETLKNIALMTLESGDPVWFGCDVGKMMRSDIGLWDAGTFDYGNVYDTTFDLDKAGRLLHHETLMTHAMLFTGVDVAGGAPRRWRVENSWGDEKSGQKGFYTMNDSWFDEYMFEIAAERTNMPQSLIAALDEEPIVLPPWDPMGSLARAR